jgi:hypothetical protein
MSHFSKSTLRKLARKGITLVGTTYLPGEGALPYATGETGYCLNDNGTHRVRTFREVLELAG